MLSDRRETVSYPDSFIAAENLHLNRLAWAKEMGRYPDYTPPAPGHYWALYLWDQCFHSITDARHGSRRSLDAAKSGPRTLLEGQTEEGFIPNLQELGPRRRVELERAFGYESKDRSNYIQPPVLALSVAEIDQALRSQTGVDRTEAIAEADEYLQEVYDPLKLFYEYFDKHRRNGPEDRRIFSIHPHETGRDSDPTYDYLKPLRLPRKGLETHILVDKANVILDYFQIIKFGYDLRKTNGDVQKARELFGATDIMMNCILVDNLDEMALLARHLGKAEDEEYFSQYASDVEEQVLTNMWFSEERGGSGIFYALDGHGQPIKESSINNLFPLVLPKLGDFQLESLLELLDSSFDTPFPLASVGKDSPNFDPNNREFERLWRGGVWQNTNWYLVERGLKKQMSRVDLASRPDLVERCNRWANRIAVSSRTLLDTSGAREFYNPITAKGQRRRVRNFGWSNLGYVISLV